MPSQNMIAPVFVQIFCVQFRVYIYIFFRKTMLLSPLFSLPQKLSRQFSVQNWYQQIKKQNKTKKSTSQRGEQQQKKTIAFCAQDQCATHTHLSKVKSKSGDASESSRRASLEERRSVSSATSARGAAVRVTDCRRCTSRLELAKTLSYQSKPQYHTITSKPHWRHTAKHRFQSGVIHVQSKVTIIYLPATRNR